MTEDVLERMIASPPLWLDSSRCAINRDRRSSTEPRADGHAEAVGDGEVDVLDLLNRARRHPDGQLREPGQPAATLPGEGDGRRAQLPRHPGCGQDVGRVTAGAVAEDEHGAATPVTREQHLGGALEQAQGHGTCHLSEIVPVAFNLVAHPYSFRRWAF